MDCRCLCIYRRFKYIMQKYHRTYLKYLLEYSESKINFYLGSWPAFAVEWWTSLLFNKIVFRLFENHNSFLYTFIRKLSLFTIYYFIYWWKQKIKVQNISSNARSTFKFVVCNNNLPKKQKLHIPFLDCIL